MRDRFRGTLGEAYPYTSQLTTSSVSMENKFINLPSTFLHFVRREKCLWAIRVVTTVLCNKASGSWDINNCEADQWNTYRCIHWQVMYFITKKSNILKITVNNTKGKCDMQLTCFSLNITNFRIVIPMNLFWRRNLTCRSSNTISSFSSSGQ